MIVKEFITDNNPTLPNGQPNPNYGQTTEVTHDLPDQSRPPPAISRPRFDHIFASAIGEVAYDDVMDGLEAVAATTPKTTQSVRVKRALRALGQTQSIEYPVSDYKGTPNPDDLTAVFLATVAAALVGSDPDITDKIDAGLAVWAAL